MPETLQVSSLNGERLEVTILGRRPLNNYDVPHSNIRHSTDIAWIPDFPYPKKYVPGGRRIGKGLSGEDELEVILFETRTLDGSFLRATMQDPRTEAEKRRTESPSERVKREILEKLYG